MRITGTSNAGGGIGLRSRQRRRSRSSGTRVGPAVRARCIGFKVESRDEVDRLFADLTGAGYRGQQPPYDAFWGARYAIVEDPDGNAVGLMSPSDPASAGAWPTPPS